MRILFVPLALLLLALCSFSTADDVVDPAAAAWERIKGAGVPDDKKDAIAGSERQMLALALAFGNLKTGEFDNVPVAKKGLASAILCLLGDDTFKSKIETALGAPDETDAISKLEITACATNPTDAVGKCICTYRLPIPYCVAIKYKEVKLQGETKPAKCNGEPLEELKNEGNKKLGAMYDYAQLVKASKQDILKEASSGEGNPEKITNNMDKSSAEFFCDAIDEKVSDKVKALMESDISYFFLDLFGAEVVIGKGIVATYANKCENDPIFKADPVAKCFCDYDKGFSFCFFKAIAEQLNSNGFLNCVKKDFDKDKKPEKVVKPAANNDNGGGSGNTTTAKPNHAPLGALSMLAVGLAALFTATRH